MKPRKSFFNIDNKPAIETNKNMSPMKKALTLTILGGLLTSAAVNAQVNIHIAGSTAFRANAFRAIRAAFDGGAPATMNPASATTGTSTVTFSGTMSNLYGSQTVTVYCAYDGSVRGLADLTGANVSFLQASGTNTVSAKVDITFSDVDKAATLFPNTPTTETPVAILPFVWCKNYYVPSSVTNITGHQIRPLLDNGLLALSFFTGNTNDDGTPMYVTGRDLDSGSRVMNDTDTYYTGTPVLYGFNTTAPTNWAVMNQNLLGSLYGFGYSSGGNVATALTNQFAGGPCVSYLGLNDALTVATTASTGVTNILSPGGGCGLITYDGNLPFNGYTPSVTTAVPAYPDFTPVKEGKYSLWSYENLETLNTHTSDNVYFYYTNMVASIDADIANAEAAGGNSAVYGPVTAIRLSEMRVTRSSVGGKILPIVTP
jgi:hypothetical protein